VLTYYSITILCQQQRTCVDLVSMGTLLFVVLNLQNKVVSFISKIFKHYRNKRSSFRYLRCYR